MQTTEFPEIVAEDFSATTIRPAAKVSRAAVDFFGRNSGIATSAKTLNTAAPGYTRRPRSIFSRIKGYLDEITEFEGDDRNGYRIRQGEIELRRMELVT